VPALAFRGGLDVLSITVFLVIFIFKCCSYGEEFPVFLDNHSIIINIGTYKRKRTKEEASMKDSAQPRSRSVISRYGWIVFLLPLLFLGYIVLDNTVFRAQIAALPDCDDVQLIGSLQGDLEASLASPTGSAPARVTNVVSRPGDTDTMRTCSGVLVMDDGSTVPLDYEIQAQDDGEFALSYELRS